MVDFAEIRKIINSSRMSVKKYNGKTVVTDSNTFRGMPLSKMEEVQDLMTEALKKDTYATAQKFGKKVDTLDSIVQRAQNNMGDVIDLIKSGKSVTAKEMKDSYTSRVEVRDSIVNGRWNTATSADPSRSNIALPNIWLSPYEANSIYSQKGLFETVINKKSKSILLNGINLRNSHLSQKQLDTVKEKMEVRNFKQMLSDSTLTSLVYGGSLTFPMFKKDTPVTTNMNLNSLLKLGVLSKDCIDYFVTLDRWQTFIIPPYNPTQKDFMRPDVYTIPFLGSDVYHGRCARIVTAKQAGYWGQIANQGWGISDLCGYLQSGMNYKVAIQSLPLMIQQMSILARVVNVDGILATEGSNALDALVEEDTIRTREASLDNPVTMDVLGDIKSIDRNFSQVPELLKLLRQDFASDAVIPEPMLFSSEKGNFSSGDDTEGNQSKQWESVKMIHKELEPQVKQLAKIMIIDALGSDDDIIEALPFTQLNFDEPVIANSVERAQIGKLYSENIFNLVSSRIPIDIAVEMASEHISSDMAVSNDILNKLKTIQKKSDDEAEEQMQLDLEKTAAEIEQIKSSIEVAEEQVDIQKEAAENPAPSSPGSKSGGSVKVKTGSGKKKESKDNGTWNRSPAEKGRDKAASDKDKTGYTKLEQKMHESTRGTTKRAEKLSYHLNQKVGTR